MTLALRKQSLIKLGNFLDDLSIDEILNIKIRAQNENQWFTESNINQSLEAIRDLYLSADGLDSLISKYNLDDNITSKKVGLVLAGNIPMVGFHDVLCCFLAGHISLIKYSEKDRLLIPFLLEKISEFEKGSQDYFEEVTRLTEYDAVIATGSNASAVHFENYFKHVPHIIRRNRNSIAILNGQETTEELSELAKDVFSYFGLGCRNVSAIFAPIGYDITKLFDGFKDYLPIVHHNKYKNNYDYCLALFLLNKERFLHNDFMILKESEQLVSRISCINYQFYQDEKHLKDLISLHQDEIQCIVSNHLIEGTPTEKYGMAQCPSIDTYADGVDTMQFLLSI